MILRYKYEGVLYCLSRENDISSVIFGISILREFSWRMMGN
jgi:hypothetical protein